MGKLHPKLPANTIPWIKAQHMFWVASAPLSGSGRVNVSPKVNEGTFHIIDEGRVWYEDLTGSGVETISHLREPDNGRVSILFHAFDGSPQIVRIYGTGRAYEYGTPEYDTFLSSVYEEAQEPEQNVIRRPGSRAIIIIDILQVMTTCGWSVPYYDFKSYRTKLHDWAEKLESTDSSESSESSPPPPNSNNTQSHHPDGQPKNAVVKVETLPESGMKAWWYNRNSHSIDGLPGLLDAFGVEGGLFSTREYPGARVESSSSSSKSSYDKDPVQRVEEKSGVTTRKSFALGLISGLSLGIGISLTLSGLLVRAHNMR